MAVVMQAVEMAAEARAGKVEVETRAMEMVEARVAEPAAVEMEVTVMGIVEAAQELDPRETAMVAVDKAMPVAKVRPAAETAETAMVGKTSADAATKMAEAPGVVHEAAVRERELAAVAAKAVSALARKTVELRIPEAQIASVELVA
jgi:hypothetical protein